MWFADMRERWRAGPGLPSMLFGVVLPIAAIGIELISQMCADALFDPLPTVYHTLLVALVPAANLWAWTSFTSGTSHPRLLAFANGTAIGVAGVYSLAFLPILPLAAIGIIFFGIGLLAWAPLLSLIAAISLRGHLRRVAAEEQRNYRMWPGLLCGLLLLVAIDLPTTLTRVGLRMATSPVQAEQLRGVRMLRAVGNEALLLQLCYVWTGRATDLVSFLFDLHSVSPDQARTVFYRVTGSPFNAHPVPDTVSRRGRGRWANMDFDQGTDRVGSRLQGLSLISSRIDGSLDGNAALGYLEWTLVVKNDSPMIREGRAQIALPPGATVSRLTLWINGEEREAAFAARGQVTQAYRAVVNQRRDPVLVTTAGADRISLQMFPIPSEGEMKVRVGMTFPLQLPSLREGVLRAPYFHQRNFEIAADLKHSVWIESKAALHSRLGEARKIPTGHTLQLHLSDEQLSTGGSVLTVRRGAQESTWARDPHSTSELIEHTLLIAPADAPKRVVFVVDSSISMASAVSQLADAIAQLPSTIEPFLVVADDSINADDLTSRSVLDMTALLRSHDYDGGKDNTSALAEGLNIAMAEPDSALIWIHGPQPVLLQTNEAIAQRLARGGRHVRWYDVQVTPGPNLIGESLDATHRIRTLSVQDLDRLLASWRPGGKQLLATRNRVAVATAATKAPGNETSAHLARLWARDEVDRLLFAEQPSRQPAIDLAHRYQLVTPVTGAVVLETQQQYDAAGLTPVPEGTVPTIPEPEEWALIAIAIGILLYAYRRRRGLPSHAAA